ncbi:hypothetical protein KY332_02245 [Candidatus Woesearchaeota archaeon]|nr:hypothetical protein [Candidatus Woesearchaeota archaeon]
MVWDKIKNVGGAAAVKVPGIVKGAVGLGGTAVSGAKGMVAGWAAMLGLDQTIQNAEDPGFVVFLGGMLVHFFGHAIFALLGATYATDHWLRIMVSLFFMFWSIFFIFKGRGALIGLLFVTWAIWFEYKPHAIFGIVCLILMVFYTMIFKWRGLGQEAIGWLAILFFYLDIGLISALKKVMPILTGQAISPLVQNLILLMPWWGFFGLFFIKKSNALTEILKFVGFAYIFIVVVAAVSPETGRESLVPGYEEIAKAQAAEEAKRELPPFIQAGHNAGCTLRFAAQPEKIEICLDEKRAEYVCKRFKKISEEDYENCLKEEKGIGEKTEVIQEFESTKIEFKELGKEWYEGVPKAGTKDEIPYNLLIEAPLDSITNVVVSCKFKTSDKTPIGGLVDSQKTITIPVIGKQEKLVSCTPEKPFPDSGQITAIFEASVSDIESISVLYRIFVGKGVWFDENKKAEIRGRWSPPLKEKQSSRAGDDFAAYSFQIGPSTFLYGEDQITRKFIGKYDDLKKEQGGEPLRVKKIEIDFSGTGITPSASCEKLNYKIDKSNYNIIWKESKGITSPLRLDCDVNIPENLRVLSDLEYFPISIKSYMTYNYQISKQRKLEIIKPE